MPKTRLPRRLADTYTFPNFRPLQTIQGLFGDPEARLIRLVRRGKKLSVESAERFTGVGTIDATIGFAIFPMERCAFISSSRYGE
jgi:hypothetical protein